ncbi:MAG TPA: glycosyltransferase family A protein [Methylomirabilota bacterium]|nr:glycosyltransferase family A protein [Methylomirabilota bacterium]
MIAGLGLPALLFLAPALWRLARVAAVLRRRGRLPRASEAPPAGGPGLVSVLVPARNEERSVGACLASLSAQTYPDLEILAVDDGSTDRTAAILADAARRDPRVRVLRLEGPPPGWTGKSFALDSGVAVARGRWLCFTDADTVHAPDSIARAMGFAERRGLALLSLTSRQITRSFWERVIQPVVFGLLDQWFPLAHVNNPASPLAAANGIFILVVRDAYEAAGGHRRVAGELLEDVALARNVKSGGGRIAFVDGGDLVAARMYTSLSAIRWGWTKNLYRLRGRRPLATLGSLLELGVTQVWPVVGCVVASLAGPVGSRWLALLGLGLVIGAEVPFRAWRGDDPRWSPTVPLGALLVAAFLLESAVRDWLGLGIRWKDRRYT